MRASLVRLAAGAVMCAICTIRPAYSSATPGASDIDAFFKPYAATNNFSGSVLVERAGKVLFAKSYGIADRAGNTPNGLATRYHIASLSILFTSTAVLRLIDQGKLSFNTRVSEIVSGVPNGDRITVRELLEQTSGLPDANDLPNYDRLLASHQTPESLVDFIRHQPPYSEPGVKSSREEHSGQNLLALILEKKTGLTFAQVMKSEVFDPLAMHDSGVDDDSPIAGPVAIGNELSGPLGLKPAPLIHWSAKTGNGSDYASVLDEAKWLNGIVHGNLLSANSREAMLGVTSGYGWEKVASSRLGETVYVAGGRSPGFSCFMEYMPADDTFVVALTNIENAANSIIIQNAAALLRGKPYQKFDYRYVSPAVAGYPNGDFTFGPDFYRPSATLRLVSDANGVTLDWPGGPAAPLLPLGKDRFLDRYYWTDVTVLRDNTNHPIELDYGKFRGTATVP